MTDVAEAPISTVPLHMRRLDPEIQSRIEGADLDREWAQRRLEMFRQLDDQFRGAIGTVFQIASEALTAAADTQSAMERQARGVIDRLEGERARLVEELREQQREREATAREIVEVRRRAEEDAMRIRGAAEDEAARVRHAAEEEAARTRNAAAEDAARMRRQAEEERNTVLRDAENRRAELMLEIKALEGQLTEVTSRLGLLVSRPGPSPDAGASATVEPARGSALSPLRQSGREPVGVSPDDTALGELGSRIGAQVRAPEPLYRASAEICVDNLPSISHAQHLLRGIQRIEGVYHARAENVESDSLVLSVEHDPRIDLTAAIERLPDVPVQLTRREGDTMEFRYPGG